MEAELNNLRRLAADLVAGKNDNAKDNKAVSSSGLLSILRVRSANKALAHATEVMKEDTGRGKCSLEAADLQLQNLLYEKQYYEKEINACRSFSSAYTDDQIALLPEAEFWATADDDLKEKAQAQGSDHELMLQRLAHEMRLRKTMQKDVEALKTAKSARLQTVASQEKMLRQLGASLKILDDTARPLHAILSGGPAIRSISRNSAELLPVGLYILYSQLAAAKDALGLPIAVSISGQVEEAEALAEAAALEATTTDVAASSADPVTAADATVTGSKKRNFAALSLDETYKTHPLSVDLDIYRDAAGAAASAPCAAGLAKPPAPSSAAAPLISVRFQFLTSLRLVTACCITGVAPGEDGALAAATNGTAACADNGLLAALFPFDDGCSSPSEAVSQLHDGTFCLDATRAAKPFKWCQHLAGIDLVPALPVFPTQLAVPVSSLLPRLTKNPLPSDVSFYTRTPQSLVAVWEPVGVGASRSMGGSKATAAAVAAAAMATKARAETVVSPRSKQQIVFQRSEKGAARGAGGAGTAEQGELGGAAEAEMKDGGIQEGMEAVDGAGDVAGGLDEGEIAPGDEEELLREEEWEAALDQAEACLFAEQHSSFEQASASEHSAQAESASGAVRPLYRLYRCIVRYKQLEVEAHARLYVEYPLRPPLFSVVAVRGMPASGAKTSSKSSSHGRVLEVVNESLAMEEQANIVGVAATPSGMLNETLLHQLLHLRLAVDNFASQYYMEHGGVDAADLASQLSLRQQLRGRDRRPLKVALG